MGGPRELVLGSSCRGPHYGDVWQGNQPYKFVRFVRSWSYCQDKGGLISPFWKFLIGKLAQVEKTIAAVSGNDK